MRANASRRQSATQGARQTAGNRLRVYCTARAAFVQFGHLAFPRHARHPAFLEMLGVGAAAAAHEGVAACTAVYGAAGLSADPQHWCSSARVNGLPQAVRARPMSRADPVPLQHRAAQQHYCHALLHAQLGPNTASATGFQGPVHRPSTPCDDVTDDVPMMLPQFFLRRENGDIVLRTTNRGPLLRYQVMWY